ncbi:MAG: hypothetical protein ACLP05_12180 [Candidatus Kryptoniota bacterium]
MGERSIYLLVHSGKSKSLDFGLGPKGRTRNQIEEFFMPELKLVDFLPRAGGLLFHQYFFARSGVTS